MSNEPESAVAWRTITSGPAAATTSATASGSSASITTGMAPRSRSFRNFAFERVVPVTWWPAATSRGTSWVPSAPVAPATRTFIVVSFGGGSQRRRDSAAGCDSPQSSEPCPLDDTTHTRQPAPIDRPSDFKGKSKPSGGHRGLNTSGRRRLGSERHAALLAVRGRRQSVVAPEALRELCRLVVANARRDRPHRDGVGGEQRPRVMHPDFRELVAEARPSHLGERALKLAARGRKLPCHPLELQVPRVVACDQVDRLQVKLLSAFRRSVSHRHRSRALLSPWGSPAMPRPYGIGRELAHFSQETQGKPLQRPVCASPIRGTRAGCPYVPTSPGGRPRCLRSPGPH